MSETTKFVELRMSQDIDTAGRDSPAAARQAPVLGETSQKALLSTGGVLGALAMSSCCILPLALFSLGVTGAWIGNLAALYPYKWFFFVPAAGFIAGGFYKVYRKPRVVECESVAYCGTPVADRIAKVALWSASALVIAAIAFPYIVPYLLES